MAQPSLHRLSSVVQAPLHVWSDMDGQMHPEGAQGVHTGDERVVSAIHLSVVGRQLEHLTTDEAGGPRATYRHVVHTPELATDPQVVLTRVRTVTADGIEETLTLSSAAPVPVPLAVEMTFTPDSTSMDQVKAGRSSTPIPTMPPVDGSASWQWRGSATTATLQVIKGALAAEEWGYVASWGVTVPPRGEVSISWRLEVRDEDAPFVAPAAPPLEVPPVVGAGVSVDRFLKKALLDLGSLRLTERTRPDDPFLAAGAPWFLTLFGRDSLISARLLAPWDAALAASTLRVLASRQGVRTDVRTAEQPGKILHEVRRVATVELRDAPAGPGVVAFALPPEYFGTIDATLLWILLLGDLEASGALDDQIPPLLPALRDALVWLRDHADPDGDGFLEYHDHSGIGLSNQGWKDSGDSIRWADGEQAEGPIALVEVQGYAYAAALVGARLLGQWGEPGEEQAWAEWAGRMRERFRSTFWVADDRGRYPALALDARKNPVTGVSSNMGHLLGTGILDPDEARVVVDRLMHPTMASGFGVRTLSTDNGGYWPLGYHVGSVWSHDTAVIIDGMLRDGFEAEAADLARQLLRAAEGFDYRLPELFGGHSADEVDAPVPYPASCRPQSWAAASAITVARALAPAWPGWSVPRRVPDADALWSAAKP